MEDPPRHTLFVRLLTLLLAAALQGDILNYLVELPVAAPAASARQATFDIAGEEEFPAEILCLHRPERSFRTAVCPSEPAAAAFPEPPQHPAGRHLPGKIDPPHAPSGHGFYCVYRI